MCPMISLQIHSIHICLQFLYSSIPLIILYALLALISGLFEKSFVSMTLHCGRRRFFNAILIAIFSLAGVLTLYQTPPASLTSSLPSCKPPG
jgi:hypothetical protein